MARENKGLRGILLLFILNFGGAKWTPTFKKKGGHTASTSNCKLTKNTIINPM
jgi:hypothetical protein